jgi:branched-chain amino acid transport system substrate-binding protein
VLLLTRRNFNFSSLAALGLSLSGLTACKPKKTDAFRIGLLSPRTGMDSQVGQACERGGKTAELLLKDNFPNLEIIYKDTESNVDIGRNKAEMLIGEQAHILIGAHNSSVTAAIAQVCEQRKIPFLINISAARKITEQSYKYIFRNFPTTDVLAFNGLTLMKALFGQKGVKPKTAALLYINDTYGQSMYEALSYYWPKFDMPKLVEIVSYDPRTQDLSGEIAKIKSSKADLLIPITRLNDAIQMIREVVKQRYNPMGIISPGSPGMYEKQFFNILAEHSEHYITNTCWHNSASPLTQKALSIFERIYPKEQFDLNVAFTIEAVLIAAHAHHKAQSFGGENLVSALRETNIEERIVLGGPIAFDQNGQALNIESVALQNRGGKPYIILPEKLQEMSPIFPFPDWETS